MCAWFAEWFNSPYYHLLYNKRDDREAAFFIDNLCAKLQLSPASKIWDIACGKGRHAVAFNKKGYDVTGTDLSPESIKEAAIHANPQLKFEVHDMRTPFLENCFDLAVNLFTSIGYFSSYEDNFLVFQNVAAALRPEGIFVVDFLNAEKVIRSVRPECVENRGDVDFLIHKNIMDGKIIKHISFKAGNKQFDFEESVNLLKKEDFQAFAGRAGMRITGTYGNYKLDEFDAGESDRLILFFQKE
jgi:SAM-dependent methyltransferase